jgi:hypothetical protein
MAVQNRMEGVMLEIALCYPVIAEVGRTDFKWENVIELSTWKAVKYLIERKPNG